MFRLTSPSLRNPGKPHIRTKHIATPLRRINFIQNASYAHGDANLVEKFIQNYSNIFKEVNPTFSKEISATLQHAVYESEKYEDFALMESYYLFLKQSFPFVQPNAVLFPPHYRAQEQIIFGSNYISNDDMFDRKNSDQSYQYVRIPKGTSISRRLYSVFNSNVRSYEVPTYPQVPLFGENELDSSSRILNIVPTSLSTGLFTQFAICNKFDGKAMQVGIDSKGYFWIGSSHFKITARNMSDLDFYRSQRRLLREVKMAEHFFEAVNNLEELRNFLQLSRLTLNFEYLSPDEMNVVPILQNEIRLVSCSGLHINKRMVTPAFTNSFAKYFGFETTSILGIFEKPKLDEITDQTRYKFNTEGVVVHLMDQHNALVSMYQIKTYWYLYLRTIFESIGKTLMNSSLVAQTKSNLKLKLVDLEKSIADRTKLYFPTFYGLSMLFVDFLVTQFPKGKLMNNFAFLPVMWKRFLKYYNFPSDESILHMNSPLIKKFYPEIAFIPHYSFLTSTHTQTQSSPQSHTTKTFKNENDLINELILNYKEEENSTSLTNFQKKNVTFVVFQAIPGIGKALILRDVQKQLTEEGISNTQLRVEDYLSYDDPSRKLFEDCSQLAISNKYSVVLISSSVLKHKHLNTISDLMKLYSCKVLFLYPAHIHSPIHTGVLAYLSFSTVYFRKYLPLLIQNSKLGFLNPNTKGTYEEFDHRPIMNIENHHESYHGNHGNHDEQSADQYTNKVDVDLILKEEPKFLETYKKYEQKQIISFEENNNFDDVHESIMEYENNINSVLSFATSAVHIFKAMANPVYHKSSQFISFLNKFEDREIDYKAYKNFDYRNNIYNTYFNKHSILYKKPNDRMNENGDIPTHPEFVIQHYGEFETFVNRFRNNTARKVRKQEMMKVGLNDIELVHNAHKTYSRPTELIVGDIMQHIKRTVSYSHTLSPCYFYARISRSDAEKLLLAVNDTLEQRISENFYRTFLDSLHILHSDDINNNEKYAKVWNFLERNYASSVTITPVEITFSTSFCLINCSLSVNLEDTSVCIDHLLPRAPYIVVTTNNIFCELRYTDIQNFTKHVSKFACLKSLFSPITGTIFTRNDPLDIDLVTEVAGDVDGEDDPQTQKNQSNNNDDNNTYFNDSNDHNDNDNDNNDNNDNNDSNNHNNNHNYNNNNYNNNRKKQKKNT